MANEWSTSAGELLLTLDPRDPGKGVQLRAALRRAIADGVLEPGTRLPSSRTLAQDLGWARGVVVDAYEQLTAEGWLQARRGSGTVVAARAPTARPPARPTQRRPQVAALDLRPARPDVASFPRTAWVAAVRAVLADLPHADLSYGDPRGHQRARATVASYLARVRGVRTGTDEVVLTNGFSAGLASVADALVSGGVGTIAVEDPGGYEPRGRLTAAGAQVVPVPVDEDGIRVDELERVGARAVMVTPAHQYPLGHVLAPGRRSELVNWARRTGGWVLEDDYDAEFRFDREPIGSLQALAPDRVVHLGSVAKTLAPAVRVGWIVVPPALASAVTRARAARESQPATLEQLTLARLIEDGRYDRHLRGLRRTYRHRRDVLVDALVTAGVEHPVEGIAAGLHAVVRVDDDVDDVALTAQLHAAGVEVVALSRYAIAAPHRGLVVGFGQATVDQLRTGAGILAASLAEP